MCHKYGDEGSGSDTDSMRSSNSESAEYRRKCKKSVRFLDDLAMGVLRVTGLLPWSPKYTTRPLAYLYQMLSVLVTGANAGLCLWRLYTDWSSIVDTSNTHAFQTVSDSVLAVGGFMGLIACGCLQASRDLVACEETFGSYARRQAVMVTWAKHYRWDVIFIVMIWVFAITERIHLHFATTGDYNPLMLTTTLLGFAVASAQISAMTLLVLRLCRGLTCVVDAVCQSFADELDCQEAVREWNLLQAVLRTACRSVAHCFFVLQATAICILLLGAVELTRGKGRAIALLPGVLVALGVSRIFMQAAMVTDKCARVPPLVNSLEAAQGLDWNRMYVVEYVAHSQAGFYIYEVRVTSAMVLKTFYLSSVFAFGATAKMLAY